MAEHAAKAELAADSARVSADPVQLARLADRVAQAARRLEEMQARADGEQDCVARQKLRLGGDTAGALADVLWLPTWKARDAALRRKLEVLGAEAAAARAHDARAVEGLRQQAGKHRGTAWGQTTTWAGGIVGSFGALELGIGAAAWAAGALMPESSGALALEAFGDAVLAGTAPELTPQQFAASMVRQAAQQPVEAAAADMEALLARIARKVARKTANDQLPPPTGLGRRGAGGESRRPEAERRFWHEAALRAAGRAALAGYNRANAALRVP